MGLTRIRAEQISDIDYKQAVRVITLSDVTLSGGAPATVDGVNLSTGNRVLVAGQSTGSQNGLYQVQTVGAGSNGTWIRSTDGNETGEIEAGMIVMVTEGTIYKDTQWKLTTNDPIVIGTTPLVFEQNSAYAFGNIYANGTAVLADAVGGTVSFAAGTNITIVGNNTSKTVTFSASGGGGSGTPGGADTNVQFNDGGSFGGTAGFNFDKTTNAVSTTGTVSATGNIQGGNLLTGGEVTATGNVTGGNLTTAGLISATGNITGGNISATNHTGTTVSVTGNVTGGNLTTAGLISATGNITGGNIIGLVSLNTRERTVNFIIDGGGSTITTGSKGYVVIDANCTIQSWTILNDVSGNANVDVLRSTYAAFPTTASIAGSIPPTTTNARNNQNTTLSGWGNTTIVSGDILEFSVQGTPANVTRTTVSLNLVSSS